MKRLYLIFLTILLLSCKTTQVKNMTLSKSLFGVVFDNKSNPIKDAKLTFTTPDSTLIVYTDIDGKFLVPELDFGDYQVNIQAKRCLATNVEVSHFDIKNILIIKVLSYQDLLIDLEDDIKNNNIISAELKIEQIMDIDSDDLYFNYLYSIYLINTQKFIEAEIVLLKIEVKDLAYINLLLADLYQYHLNDKKNAIYHLKRFLDREYREKETERLKELLNDI